MATATASPAKVAALPELKTPTDVEGMMLKSSRMLPSELPRSPLSGLSGPIKVEAAEDYARTPITPPTAYTDFLKALSPAVSTPVTASSMKSAFSFTDRSGHLTPITQPPSAGSSCSCKSSSPDETASSASSSASSTTTVSSTTANSSSKRKLPAAATSAPLVPPTPFVRPPPARRPSARTPTTLGKLRIPESPTSSIISQSPCSGSSSNNTPQSATPRSAVLPAISTSAATPTTASALRSPFSPTSWYIEGRTKMFGAPPPSAGAGPRHVSVKQVVTRTVTYTSRPLEPAPRGKRRKVE